MRVTTGDNGIPGDYPTRVVREDPDRQGLLYAGTEFGMFISFDDGGEWNPLQLNLPVTPVTDIKVVDQDLVLSTMGRGFWILYDLTPFHEWRPRQRRRAISSKSNPLIGCTPHPSRALTSTTTWRANLPEN